MGRQGLYPPSGGDGFSLGQGQVPSLPGQECEESHDGQLHGWNVLVLFSNFGEGGIEFV